MTPHLEHSATKPAPLLVVAKLRLALQGENVRFCHWKSNGHLAQALEGKTDIDLFVAPADQSAFQRIVKATGALKMLSQPWGRYPDVEDWLLFDEPTGGFLHLHVHYALMTGLKRVKHLRIPWEDALLGHLRIDPPSGWPIPSAEMELLILLVRIWAKMPPLRRLFYPIIPTHIFEELEWLRHSSNPEELIRLAEQLKLRVDPATLLDLLKPDTAPTAHIIDIAKALNRELQAHHRMSWIAALALAGVLNLRLMFGKASRRMGYHSRLGKTVEGGSLMLAFVGSDGSGKSTLTRDVKKWLRYKLDAHIVYMGSGDGKTGLLNTLRRKIIQTSRLAGSRTKKKSGGRRKEAGATGFFSNLARLHHLVLIHRKLRLLRLARRMTKSGSSFITDRYPQNQFHGINDGPKLQDGRGFLWAGRAELKLYEEASRLGRDLVLKLSIDPQTAHHRKPDHDLFSIARKCKIVDQLSFSQAKVVVIDAGQHYSEVLLATKKAVWSTLRENQA